MLTFNYNKLEELNFIGKRIIEHFNSNRTFLLYGSMGAGKTTLIKSLCNALNVKQIVNSPTFAIVNEYFTLDNKSIYHFDFYRIKKIEEVYDIGFEEYLYSNNYCFIEWPEKIEELLPDKYVYINIKLTGKGEERIINCKSI